jgi:tRNA(Ile)-lysidine synthetase-like protein
VTLPHGELRFESVEGRGVDRRARRRGLSIRPRHGGETPQARRGPHARALKSILRESSLPTWERDALPLVVAGDVLVAVRASASTSRGRRRRAARQAARVAGASVNASLRSLALVASRPRSARARCCRGSRDAEMHAAAQEREVDPDRRAAGRADGRGAHAHRGQAARAAVDDARAQARADQRLHRGAADVGNARRSCSTARGYKSMFAAIEAARDHVHLESYIFDDVEVGRRLSDL